MMDDIHTYDDITFNMIAMPLKIEKGGYLERE